MSNFFDGVDEFRVIDVNSVVLPAAPDNFIVTREPNDFKVVEFVLDRNPLDRGGVNFEYGSGEGVTLSFDNFAGRGLIKQILDIAGSDAQIQLVFLSNGVIQFTQDFDSFNNADDVRFFLHVKRELFGDKLRSRFKTVLDMAKTVNLDGGVITPLTLLDQSLHSKSLRQIEDRDVPERIAADLAPSLTFLWRWEWTNANTSNVFFWQPQFAIQNVGSVNDFFEYGNIVFEEDLALASGGFTILDPLVQGFSNAKPEDLNFFSIDFKGLKGTFNVSFDLDIDVQFVEGAGVNVFTLETDLRVIHTNATNVVITEYTLDTDSTAFSGGTTNITASGSQVITVDKADRLFIYVRNQPAAGVSIPVSMDVEYDNINAVNINIEADTTDVPTNNKGNYIFDVLDKAIEYATGESGALESTLLDFDTGCAGLDWWTTGNLIREINTEAFVSSIQTLLQTNMDRYGAGFATYDDSGTPKVLFELHSHFFQDKEILELDSVVSPVIMRFNDQISWGDIRYGWSKGPRSNEKGTIEGFNVEYERRSPLVKEGQDGRINPLAFASGTEIERIRRISLMREADTSDEKADDNAMIRIQCFNTTNPYTPMAYIDPVTLQSIIFCELSVGQVIVHGLIVLGVGIGDFIYFPAETEREITGAPVLDYENNQTIFPTDGVSIVSVLLNNFHFRDSTEVADSLNVYSPQRVQGFNNITGLINPPTEYNIFHAPSHMFIANFSWFGGSVEFKPGTDVYSFQTKKLLTKLSKEFTDTDCFPTTDAIDETEDFLLSDLRTWNPAIFTNKVYTVRARLSKELFDRWRLAMLNEHPEDINYGFIKHPDHEGNIVDAFSFPIKYHALTEEVETITWGKA